MRALLLSILLAAAAASAETPGATQEPACVGCVVLTPEDVEQQKAAFLELMRRAFEAGRADQRQRCASLI